MKKKSLISFFLMAVFGLASAEDSIAVRPDDSVKMTDYPWRVRMEGSFGNNQRASFTPDNNSDYVFSAVTNSVTRRILNISRGEDFFASSSAPIGTTGVSENKFSGLLANTGLSEFELGMATLGASLASLREEEAGAEAFCNSLRVDFSDANLVQKLGGLAYLNWLLYKGPEAYGNNRRNGTDDLIKDRFLYSAGALSSPEVKGVCRHYAMTTAQVAANGLNLNSTVIGGYRHVLVQVACPDGSLVIIDKGSVFSNIDGQIIRNKDDADVAVNRITKKPDSKDIFGDPASSSVVYENRYNNFSGFWRKLQNWDNRERLENFIVGSNMSLFTSQNDRGIAKVSATDGVFGVQAYISGDDNRYSRFLKNVYGFNSVFCLSSESNNPRWHNVLFLNLGAYCSGLDLSRSISNNNLPSRITRETNIIDVQSSLENYISRGLARNLSLGLVIKGYFNREMFRSEGEINKEFSGRPSVSPFLRWDKNFGDKLIFVSLGSEITDYLAVPDLYRLNFIPWFLSGWKYQADDMRLGLSLRGEFQPVSQRFDFISDLQKGKNGLRMKLYGEHFNAWMKEHCLFSDILGSEIVFSHVLWGKKLSTAIAVERDNCRNNNVNLNFGVEF